MAASPPHWHRPTLKETIISIPFFIKTNRNLLSPTFAHAKLPLFMFITFPSTTNKIALINFLLLNCSFSCNNYYIKFNYLNMDVIKRYANDKRIWVFLTKRFLGFCRSTQTTPTFLRKHHQARMPNEGVQG